MTIVGVAADIHTAGLTAAPMPQVYFPYPQWPTRTMAIVAEARGSDVASAVHAADPAVPLFSVHTMEERVAQSVERPRLRARLFSTYGALAFALAAFGIYSMGMYTALRRQREFALRAALGATRGRLLKAMLAGTLIPACGGAAGGLAGAYAIAHAIRAFLYGAKAADPAVYVVSALVTLGVAALATGLGGRRALDADPAEVLRGE